MNNRVKAIVDEITDLFDLYDHDEVSMEETFRNLFKYKNELSNMSIDHSEYTKIVNVIYSINRCMEEMLKLENKELDDSVNNIISHTMDIIEWKKEE